jgi:hypothetical protein
MLMLLSAPCYLFHCHKYFIDPGNVFLDLCNVVLKDSQLHSFARSESLHNGSVFISYVLFNHVLHGFDLVDSMVEPHNLPYELSSFGDHAVVNCPVNQVEPASERLLN